MLVLVGLLVLGRVVVAGVLVLGPWTDEPAELRGWDAERFQEIVDAPGRPHHDHAVEYPPGAVLVLEGLAGSSVPATQDRLVLLGLGCDLAVAVVLAARWRGPAAVAWLVLGLPLLPGSYLRFDLLSVLLAVGAAALVARPGRAETAGRTAGRSAAAGVALVAAVSVKTWPVVLLPGWLRAGRRGALGWAAAIGGLAGVAWLWWGGVQGPAQVLGFRGASGWHVESTPGLVAGLLGGGSAALEAGAYRLGEATPLVSGPLLLVFVVGTAAIWRRALGAPPPVGEAAHHADHDHDGDESALVDPVQARDEGDARDALAALGATCLLLVTAPLLSPQYLVWTLPWAAIAWARGERGLVLGVGSATVLTAGVLAAFGPPGVDVAPAQLLLLLRNGLLAAVVVLTFRRLGPERSRTSAAAGPTAGEPARGAPAGSSPGS